MKKLPLIFSQLVLLLMLVITSIAPVSAKVVSGASTLGSGLHQSQALLEATVHQGLEGFSYDDASGSPLVTKSAKDRIQVKDVTNPGAKSRNFQIDKTKSQFEKHLTDNGFDKKSVGTPKGDINIFSKNGQKEFTTRDFSKSTNGPSGEIFTGGSNKASAKIRFLEE